MRFFYIFFVLATVFLASARAQTCLLTTSSPASFVIGQSDLTSSTSGSGAAQLSAPQGVALSPTTGKVFVADENNNRVQRFASAAAAMNGASAEQTFGGVSGCSQAKLNFPKLIYVDG